MKHFPCILIAAAVAISASSAAAQSVASSVAFPAGFAPGQSVCVRQPDGTCVPVGSSTPLPVRGGSSSIATGQVSVDTSATLVRAATVGRAKITVAVGSANSCAIGNVGVTSVSGFPLQPVAGATLTLDTSAAIYAVCSALTIVSYIEQF